MTHRQNQTDMLCSELSFRTLHRRWEYSAARREDDKITKDPRPRALRWDMISTDTCQGGETLSSKVIVFEFEEIAILRL